MTSFYDYWKGAYLKDAGISDAGATLFRISFGSSAPERTVSEGQGYGMVIVAFMAGYDPNARVFFDGLWRFVRLHPSRGDSRLMDWDVPDAATGDDSAFDGDADIAFSLLLAHAQWGSDGGVNYLLDGQTVIAGIFDSTIGPASRLPTLGDWVVANGGTYNQYTPRSSDFMPSHFRAFGSATSNATWNTVVTHIEEAVEYIQTKYSPDAGLLPDFLVSEDGGSLPLKPAPPNFLEGPRSNYTSDQICRAPSATRGSTPIASYGKSPAWPTNSRFQTTSRRAIFTKPCSRTFSQPAVQMQRCSRPHHLNNRAVSNV